MVSSERHKNQSGGAVQYAYVSLSIEPWEEWMPERSDLTVRSVEKIDLEWGGTLVFQNCIVGGVLDSRFIPAVLKGILEKMERGPLTEDRKSTRLNSSHVAISYAGLCLKTTNKESNGIRRRRVCGA